MLNEPLLAEEDDNDVELIPKRRAVDHPFSKPIAIRSIWLVLIVTALILWRVGLNGNWQVLLAARTSWLWLVPVAWLWWKTRRWYRFSSRRRTSLFADNLSSIDEDDEAEGDAIRLVADPDADQGLGKLLFGVVAYVVAVLAVFAVAVWKLN